MVWTNDRIIRWIKDIGLKEYADNLLESGIHGSVVALDDQFSHESLALALQIPASNRYVSVMCGMECLIQLRHGTDSVDNEEDFLTCRRENFWSVSFVI